eukprot:jgi/Astpho2/3829/Aster-04352
MIIVLLVHEGDQQPALTEPKGLRCYHSLEVLNCGTTLGSRVFLGGANGNLYEVVTQVKSLELVCWTGIRHQHSARELWEQAVSTLPGFCSRSSLIKQLVTDPERRLLYALHENNLVQVFSIASGFNGTLTHVQSIPDLRKAARSAARGTEVLDEKGREDQREHIVLVAPVPKVESSRLLFFVMTTDGRRAYFGTAIRDSTADTLKACSITMLAARDAIPCREVNSSRPLNIEAACYTRGLLLVSEAVQNGTASRVLAVAKDLSVSGGSGSREQAPPYKEMVDEMNGGRPLLPDQGPGYGSPLGRNALAG